VSGTIQHAVHDGIKRSRREDEDRCGAVRCRDAGWEVGTHKREDERGERREEARDSATGYPSLSTNHLERKEFGALNRLFRFMTAHRSISWQFWPAEELVPVTVWMGEGEAAASAHRDQGGGVEAKRAKGRGEGCSSRKKAVGCHFCQRWWIMRSVR
jgi:hypothetical protein